MDGGEVLCLVFHVIWIFQVFCVPDVSAAGHRRYYSRTYSYRYYYYRSGSSHNAWIAGAVLGTLFGFIILVAFIYVCCHSSACQRFKPKHSGVRGRPVQPLETASGNAISVMPSTYHFNTVYYGMQPQSYGHLNQHPELPGSSYPPPPPSYGCIYPGNTELPPQIPGYRPEASAPISDVERAFSPPPAYAEVSTTQRQTTSSV